MYKLKYILWLIAFCIASNGHANDLCDNATTINQLGIAVQGSTTGAETEWSNSCGYNKFSVWYTFTPLQTTIYNIKIDETVDATTPAGEPAPVFNDVLTLYSGDCTGGFSGLIEISCTNDDEFGFVGERVYTELTAGTKYYIMVSSDYCLFGKAQGDFSITINTGAAQQGQPNEDCSGAELISASACITGSNINASKANPQPSCSAYSGASVWYQTVATTDKIKLSAAPNFSEIITVYEGTSCGDLEEKACYLNDIPANVQGNAYSDELIVTNLTIGQTYFIQITGTFASLEAAFDDNACNEDIPYVTLSAEIDCATLNGKSCNDNNPNTINDAWDGDCNCIGICANVIATVCDDGNPNTIGDVWVVSSTGCSCVGNCDVDNSNCPNGYVNDNCECECSTTTCQFGQYLDDDCTCVNCPSAGTPCDDGYYFTTDDVWTEWCTCAGTLPQYCPADLTILDIDVYNEAYYQVSNSIKTDESANASVLVEQGEKFTLNAGNQIKLKPGFRVEAGASFHGYIEGCEFNLKTDESTLAAVKHYPNPFKNEINLEFTLDFDAEVQVIVSDVNGRKVAHIPTENLYQGTQTIKLSTENWIAGVYFYQATIKEQSTGILKRATGTIVKM